MADINARYGISVNETLLSNVEPGSGDKLLMEGLVTNFFVGTCLPGSCLSRSSRLIFPLAKVKNSKVFTAGSGVLIGSTRELVLKACAELGVDVVLESPRLSERQAWQGAFVTSTVSLFLISKLKSVPLTTIASRCCSYDCESGQNLLAPKQ